MILDKVFKILKWIAIVGVVVFIILGLLWILLPTGPRERMEFDDPWHENRVAVIGENYMVVTGTPQATKAAVKTLENGGNAYDASVAALLGLNVTFGEAASFPGVAPTLIYDSSSGEVRGYVGAGKAPSKATIELFENEGHEEIPKTNIKSQLLPASPDVLTTLLQEHGTTSFSEVSSPAISLAENGFPVHNPMLKNLDMGIIERLGFKLLMPYNVEVYLDGQWWRPLHYRERFTRPDLANTFRKMGRREREVLNENKSREQALQAVRDYFYEGPIAQKIVDFHEKKGGLFTLKDLENYEGYWEEPITGEYGDYTVYSNRTWCQGAVVPMALQILAEKDLKSMGHNSPEYIHTVNQAVELAMADREAYFGDPDFVDVPVKGLLSENYADARRKAMTPGKAFTSMPEPGDAWQFQSGTGEPYQYDTEQAGAKKEKPNFSAGKDTSYLCIVDSEGNVVSMTPSDFPMTPMVPETGLTLGNRMTQFKLDPKHPDSLKPGKRPRITPAPGLVTKNDEFFLVFGTPGGDMQPQAMIQVFLNIVEFGMDPQEAVEAYRFRSKNFPASFSYQEYLPGTIELESSLYEKTGKALENMGYEVKERKDWSYNDFGAVCVIIRDPDNGQLIGGAGPRQQSWAEGK